MSTPDQEDITSFPFQNTLEILFEFQKLKNFKRPQIE